MNVRVLRIIGWYKLVTLAKYIGQFLSLEIIYTNLKTNWKESTGTRVEYAELYKMVRKYITEDIRKFNYHHVKKALEDDKGFLSQLSTNHILEEKVSLH